MANRNWLFAAILAPFLMGGLLGLLGIDPTRTVTVAEPAIAAGSTITVNNPAYDVLLYFSVVLATGFMYLDMRKVPGLREELGAWRFVFLILTMILYLPIFLYWWERRKFANKESVPVRD